MSDIEKMRRYADSTVAKAKRPEFYDLRLSEMLALYDFQKLDFWEMLYLAFNYGRAKGYRMAKKEVRG